MAKKWAAGVDLGGTKIQLIQIDELGTAGERIRCPTDVAGGEEGIVNEIASALRQLEEKVGSPPEGVGVGVAGQIEKGTGTVIFAPNLKWHNAPFEENLKKMLDLPVVILNDVRAAAWGEWLHGAGKGCENLICIFVGTGVGGGIVSEGEMLAGARNSAGEIGHMVVLLDGPECTCGNRGCMEALAGGWAITRQAKERVKEEPEEGKRLLGLAEGEVEKITGQMVDEAAADGDRLATEVIDRAVAALAAGTTSLVNALSPERIVFGGGVIEGSPEFIGRIEEKVKKQALEAATKDLEFVRAKLHNDAGAIGAGALALKKCR